MKALFFTLLLSTVYLQVSWQAETLSGDEDVCRLFQDGTQIRKPGFCDRFVKCENLQSVDETICTVSTPYYDKKDKKCVAKVPDTYCESPCTEKSNTYAKDKKNCKGWFQCKGNATVAYGQCAHGMYLDVKEQLCMYPEQTSCSATYDICKDIAPTKTKFRDENNCHKYFTCETSLLTGAKAESSTCPAGLYFDAKTGECIAKALVDCYKHPYPENICGTTKIPYRNRFVRDGATCRGYFYCKDPGENSRTPDKAPSWGQCFPNEFFDESTQSCRVRTFVSCDEDRCDGIESGKTLSAKKGCQYYLTCEKYATTGEHYCGNGLYFNEQTHECTSFNYKYNACT